MRKNLGSTKCPRKKFGIHQIPTRKNFGLTNYPQKHGGAMTLDPRGEQWHVIKLKKCQSVKVKFVLTTLAAP